MHASSLLSFGLSTRGEPRDTTCALLDSLRLIEAAGSLLMSGVRCFPLDQCLLYIHNHLYEVRASRAMQSMERSYRTLPRLCYTSR
jgi:hypothetical protein